MKTTRTFEKAFFVFVCLVILITFLLIVASRAFAQAEDYPLKPANILVACTGEPLMTLDLVPTNLDWNSDSARVFNCYDEKLRVIRGWVWGTNLPPAPDINNPDADVRILYGKTTVSYKNTQLTVYERTVTSRPEKDGVQHIYFEVKVPDCLDRSLIRVVTDYYERDLQGHGMKRDWSGEFYAQSFCANYPIVLYIPPGPPKQDSCCDTCAIKWYWLEKKNGVVTRHLLSMIDFVDLAKRQMNMDSMFTLWSPDEIEGIIVCDIGTTITDITVKIYRMNGVELRDISDRAQDLQFQIDCGTVYYITDKLRIIVTYKHNGCDCATGKEMKDPHYPVGRVWTRGR